MTKKNEFQAFQVHVQPQQAAPQPVSLLYICHETGF